MPFTDEQRAKAVATRRAKAAVKTDTSFSAATAVAEPPSDDVGDLLKLLGASLADVQKAKGTEDQILTLLGQLDPKQHADLFRNPKVQAFVEAASEKQATNADMEPGTVINAGQANATARPWTWKDVWAKFPVVEFTPAEDEVCIFDGLAWKFRADVTVQVPKIFVDLYQESRANRRFQREHAAFLFKAGGPTHADMLTPESARVRGAGTGTYLPGAGADAGAAPAPPAE